MPMPLAHAKWFVDDPSRYRDDWTFLASAETVAAIAAVGCVAAVTLAVVRLVGVPARSADLRLTAVAPRLLAIGLGITLPILAAQQQLLLPGVTLEGAPGGTALAAAEALLGSWLVSGRSPRIAAAGLAGLCVVTAFIGGPLALLEGAYVPAIAVYLAAPEWPLVRRLVAVALGVSLVTASLTEKLVAPEITAEVLRAHPQLDPLTMIGVAVPEATFVRVAGAVELVLGLLLVSGIGGRAVALVAIVPFVATVPIFGLAEIVGHLPIYAVLIAVAAGREASARIEAGRDVTLATARVSPQAQGAGGSVL
jgi:hypothetical protein